ASAACFLSAPVRCGIDAMCLHAAAPLDDGGTAEVETRAENNIGLLYLVGADVGQGVEPAGRKRVVDRAVDRGFAALVVTHLVTKFSLVDRRTAAEQGMRPGQSAVVAQRTEQGTGIELGILRQARMIEGGDADQVVRGGCQIAGVDRIM